MKIKRYSKSFHKKCDGLGTYLPCLIYMVCIITLILYALKTRKNVALIWISGEPLVYTYSEYRIVYINMFMI